MQSEKGKLLEVKEITSEQTAAFFSLECEWTRGWIRFPKFPGWLEKPNQSNLELLSTIGNSS